MALFRNRRLRHADFAEASKAESSLLGYKLSAEGYGPQADG